MSIKLRDIDNYMENLVKMNEEEIEGLRKERENEKKQKIEDIERIKTNLKKINI